MLHRPGRPRQLAAAGGPAAVVAPSVPLVAGALMVAVVAALALFVLSPWGAAALPFVASFGVVTLGWLLGAVAAWGLAVALVAVAHRRAVGRP